MMLSAIGASLVVRAPNDNGASTAAAADIEFHFRFLMYASTLVFLAHHLLQNFCGR